MSEVRAVMVPADVADRIAATARARGTTEAAVVAAALDALYARLSRPPGDPWEPVPVVGTYRGVTITGEFTPATRRLRVTSDPLPNRVFKSPSGASRAVTAALNPARGPSGGNGWDFWRLAANGARLAVYH